MSAIELTDENFDATIDEGGIVLVDFWADWCGPCKQFAPVFEKSAENHPDVVHGKLDTEAAPRIAAAAQIRAIPTLMVFRDGVLVFNQSGVLPASALEQVVDAVKNLDMDEVRADIAEHKKAQQQA